MTKQSRKHKSTEEQPVLLPGKLYKRELYRLQAELVKVQEWVRQEGARLIVVFEGRDAAGKGSTIKRVTQYLNPRIARIVALPAPTERERTQWYFGRYIQHLPAAGEIALFDRSWYNRAGVERVMGFCTETEYRRFLHQCPIFERLLVEDGVLLRKYWFSVRSRRRIIWTKRGRRHSESRPAVQAHQGDVACRSSAAASSSFTQSCGGPLARPSKSTGSARG